MTLSVAKQIIRHSKTLLDFATIALVIVSAYVIILLPGTKIAAADFALASDEFAGPGKSPFVNDEFIFYWSAIDPLFSDSPARRNWYYVHGYSDANNREDRAWGNYRVANLDLEEDYPEYIGASFYGESMIWDEGAIAISSYDANNEVEVWLMDGHLINDIVPDKYVNITGIIDDRPVGPEIIRVDSPTLLWKGALGKWEGKILYTSDDLALYDGTLRVKSSGRISILETTVTDGYIDWNGNGIADPLDTDPENADDSEVAHGIDTAWFANGLSDDAMWSFYGSEFFGFVHRDLVIAAYDDNTQVTVTDMSDGDDNFKVTLDSWENYVYGASHVSTQNNGDNDNTAGDDLNGLDINDPDDMAIIESAIDHGHNFEADFVHLKSSHPVTLIGGLFDNNLHSVIYGQLGRRFNVPVPTGLQITAEEPETSVDIIFKDHSVHHEVRLENAGDTYQITAPFSRSQSNNFVMEAAWARIDSQHPIRVEVWQANDDNAFDMTQEPDMREGVAYPLAQSWSLHLHHRAIVYITSLVDNNKVGWSGDFLEGSSNSFTLGQYETRRIIVDEYEDYDGDGDNDILPDNQEELEKMGAGFKLWLKGSDELMVKVRYGADYSCEPQDANMVLSYRPILYDANLSPVYILPPITAIFLAMDVAVTAAFGFGPMVSFLGNPRRVKLADQ